MGDDGVLAKRGGGCDERLARARRKVGEAIDAMAQALYAQQGSAPWGGAC